MIVTKVLELTKDWQALGTGTVLMRANVPGVVFAVSDTKPSLPIGSGFSLPDDDNYSIKTKGQTQVWVKLTYDQAEGKLSFVVI